jgi:hypothetical protein
MEMDQANLHVFIRSPILLHPDFKMGKSSRDNHPAEQRLPWIWFEKGLCICK